MSDPGILQPEGWALYFLVVIQWIQPLVDHQKVECRIPGVAAEASTVFHFSFMSYELKSVSWAFKAALKSQETSNS